MGLACKLVISDITGAKQFKDAVTMTIWMTVSTDRLITREKRSLIATLATTATIAKVDLRVFSTVYTRLPKGHPDHTEPKKHRPLHRPQRVIFSFLCPFVLPFLPNLLPLRMSIG